MTLFKFNWDHYFRPEDLVSFSMTDKRGKWQVDMKTIYEEYTIKFDRKFAAEMFLNDLIQRYRRLHE